MKSHRPLVLFATALTIAVLFALAPSARAAETPRRGGVLLAAIAADAPSLDPHQEETFATLELVAPCYSTLLQIDPLQYPKVIGDVATEWKIAADGLTYTFKLRQGIRFHDGSPLTAADVKATYEKIVFPPAGVRSIRKNAYAAVTSLEAPDANTIVFKLKHPSASLLANLASPWNVIYPKKYLDKDPNYFKANIVGSGPFKFKSHTRGSTFEAERNPDYFIKDRPYLDGYKFFVITETSARAAAIRSGRAWIEFRTMPLSEVEAIRKQLGDKVVVQDTPATGIFGIAVNQTIKPFNDERVRKALTLGLDRYTASRVLYPIASLKDVGGLMRPGTEWAMSDAELQKFPGFGKDIEKNRAEAKRLLAEAGYPNGIQNGLEEPQRPGPVHRLRHVRDPGVAQDRHRGRAPDSRDRVLVRGWPGQRQLPADRQPFVQLHGRPRPVPRAVHHGRQQQLGAILRSADRRPLHPPGEISGSHGAQEAHQRDREDRARARVLHPGYLVGAERGALGEGEELRGAAQSLLEPEAAGRVAQRGLMTAML